MRLALYQPDIAGNTGTMLRLGACLGVAVDIIEPCGFAAGAKQLHRAAMDYGVQGEVRRHADWAAFEAWRRAGGHRLVLLSSKATVSLYAHPFTADDILLMGSESAGVPDAVAAMCDCRIRIPMRPGFRSLNVAVAAGMALGEGVRQLGLDGVSL